MNPLPVPSGEPVATLEFTLTTAEIRDFWRLAQRYQRSQVANGIAWLRILAICLAVLVGAAVAYLLEPGTLSRVEASWSGLFAGMAAMLTAWLLLSAISAVGWRMPRAVSDQAFAARRISLYAEGIGADGAFTRGFFPWQAVAAVRLYERFVVFWLGSLAGIPVPVSAVGSREKLREIHEQARSLRSQALKAGEHPTKAS